MVTFYKFYNSLIHMESKVRKNWLLLPTATKVKMKILYPFLALASISASAAKPRPNVVLIITDQHRYDFIGAENASIITPNLDRLCGDGVRFVNGYSSTPSSTPARAAILTGQSPWHHGMLGYYPKVGETYPCELPAKLHEAGYYLHAVGKMHWAPQRTKHSFDKVELDESGRVESEGFVSDYRQWFAQVAPDRNPDATGIGWNEHAAAPYALPEELHPTVWTGDRGVQAVKDIDKNRPFFLKLSFARPHSPYDAPKRYLDIYKDRAVPEPWVAPWAAGLANYPRSKDAAFGDYGLQYAINSRRNYAANITFVDEQIGRVIDELKARGLYDNTLIIFTSDHGDMLGEHHHWRKTYPYQGSTHVPFVVKLPNARKGERGKVRNELVEMRDILPTFLDAAGLPIPDGVDGASILSLFTKSTKNTWRKYLDLEHAGSYGPKRGWVALTDGTIKYVWNYEKGTEELYDLSSDAHEMRNLALDTKYAQTMEQYRSLMSSHLAERGSDWVRDGKLQVLAKPVLLTPSYPKQKQ